MKGEKRLVRALQQGWGFQGLYFNKNRSQRHHLWVTAFGDVGWRVHKVNADVSRENYLLALLDEAGVPK